MPFHLFTTIFSTQAAEPWAPSMLSGCTRALSLAAAHARMLREAPLSRVSAAAAIATRARQPAAARQLVDFLASRDAAEVVAATGLDPIRR